MKSRVISSRPTLKALVNSAIWLASIACSQRESASSWVTVRDSAGIVIVENDVTRAAAICAVSPDPTVVIGSAAAGTEYELYRVFGAARLSDGRIVLVNQGSQQLRFYDHAGRFLTQAGRPGQGPGEFQDAFYLWVLPGDTIWVGDYRPWQFLVFAPDGQWVRTVRPRPEYANPPGETSVLDDGRSILADRAAGVQTGSQFRLRQLTVVVHAPDGTLLDTLGTYPNGRYGQLDGDPRSVNIYPLFESFARIEGAGSAVVVGHTTQAQLSIFRAGDVLALERIVRWTTGSRTISSEDVEAERRRIAEPYKDLDPAMRLRVLDPLVSKDRPVADQFPAFASVKLGRDGRLWVREYSRPTAPQTHRWLAFADDGRFQCHATTPAFDELLEFGDGYLLALHRDSLGVERVVQHPIGLPTAPK
jgi:hypothetical protein